MNNLQRLLKHRRDLNYYLREFLDFHQYQETDVPTLSPKVIPESYVDNFTTVLTSPSFRHPGGGGDSPGVGKPAYLLTSPEAYLKRLLAMGSGNIYFLGKAFRNGEPLGKMHNHEFTILEWYKIGYSYFDLMKEIEQMIRFIALKMKIDIGIDFASPWEYLSVEKAYSKFTPRQKIGPENFEQNYVQYLEPNLGTRGKPTFIYDFPIWQSPMAKTRNGWAKRFELYIMGVELVNGCEELNDWQKQSQNLETEKQLRNKLGRQALAIDDGFLESLKKGLPDCSGAAIGIDRLLMVLAGYESIQEVILFPTSKLFSI